MKALGAIAAAGLLAIGAGAANLASAEPAAPAPPPAANVARASLDGEALFLKHCGYCHLAGGTGTIQLERRWGKERALLTERTDIPADYVKAVARNGVFSMPPITRVEVPDEELDKLAEYLAMPDKKAAQ